MSKVDVEEVLHSLKKRSTKKTRDWIRAAFLDEPDRVTAAQMDRWCRDFDNWGIW